MDNNRKHKIIDKINDLIREIYNTNCIEYESHINMINNEWYIEVMPVHIKDKSSDYIPYKSHINILNKFKNLMIYKKNITWENIKICERINYRYD